MAWVIPLQKNLDFGFGLTKFNSLGQSKLSDLLQNFSGLGFIFGRFFYLRDNVMGTIVINGFVSVDGKTVLKIFFYVKSDTYRKSVSPLNRHYIKFLFHLNYAPMIPKGYQKRNR